MACIFYVHWHKDEALETVRRLRAAGHSVDYHWSTGEEAWRLLKDGPPDALAISLDRLPSHGRAVASVTTESKRLRGLPLVFVGGQPEKVAATKRTFPRATYCVESELEKVLARLKPFVPPDPAARKVMKSKSGSDPKPTGKKSAAATTGPSFEPAPAGYSGTPLPQKLGIKPRSHVALVNAPAGFSRTLGALPTDARVESIRVDGQPHDVIVLFCANRRALERSFKAAARRLEPAGGLWVSWPKKASGVATDLTEDVVRAVGLAAGLVDNKVCAIDATWSGLRFVYRKKDRPAKR